MSLKPQQKAIWAVVAVIVVVVLIYLAWPSAPAYNPPTNNSPVSATNNPASQTAPTAANTNAPVKAPTAAPAAPKPLSYSEAISAYKYRIQFVKCQPYTNSPGVYSLTLTKNTPIMLDNRDAVVRTIGVQGKTYRISGYDYAVAYPGRTGTSAITCDGRDTIQINVH